MLHNTSGSKLHPAGVPSAPPPCNDSGYALEERAQRAAVRPRVPAYSGHPLRRHSSSRIGIERRERGRLAKLCQKAVALRARSWRTSDVVESWLHERLALRAFGWGGGGARQSFRARPGQCATPERSPSASIGAITRIWAPVLERKMARAGHGQIVGSPSTSLLSTCVTERYTVRCPMSAPERGPRRFRPKFGEFGRNPVGSAQHWSSPRRMGPKQGRRQAKSAEVGPIFEPGLAANPFKTGQMPRLRAISTKHPPKSAKFGQLCPESAEIDQAWAAFVRRWTEVAQVRPN